MTKIALVNPDGTVAAVYTGADETYSDGIQYGEQVARALPDGANPDEVLDCWRWAGIWIIQEHPTQNLNVEVVAIVSSPVIE